MTTAPAKHRPPSPFQLASDVVSVSHNWPNSKQLELHLTIAQGHHLNAHQVPEGLIPTRLSTPDESPTIEYPPGQNQSFAFFPTPIRVYTGSITLVLRFPNPIPTNKPLLLRLSYQPCNYDACLPPITKELHIPPPSAHPHPRP